METPGHTPVSIDVEIWPYLLETTYLRYDVKILEEPVQEIESMGQDVCDF